MTPEETRAGAALHAWIADEGGEVSDRDKQVFLEAYKRGLRDAPTPNVVDLLGELA